MQAFYSDEQYREYCDEIAGDGYSNEYQRASAQAMMENPPRNDRAEVLRLTQAGKHVVVMTAPYECRITSAILGEEFIMIAAYDERLEAESHAWDLHQSVCDDASAFVFQLPTAPAAAPVAPDFDDEVPF